MRCVQRINIVFGIIFALYPFQADAEEALVQGKTNPEIQQDFQILLSRLENGDRSVHFGDLRRAYVLTESYEPYGFSGEHHAAGIMNLLKNESPKTVIAEAERVLARDFFDIATRGILSHAYKLNGEDGKSEFQVYVANAIVEAVLNSGDGLSPETAYQVLSVREENMILLVLGLQKKRQALVQHEGHLYDQISATNKNTGESQGVWFNIDWLAFGATNTILKEN